MGRKTNEQDLALLRETEALNPFSVKLMQRKPVWEEVALRLRTCELKVEMNGRSCKDRVNKLLKEYRSDETLSSKASGIEEEGLTELKDLLAKISQLETCTSPKLNTIYAKHNRDAARKVQLEALELMEDNDEEDEVDPVTAPELKASEPSVPCDTAEPPKKKARKTDMVAYLSHKNKNELAFKVDELQVRKLEAENRALELKIKAEQQEADNKLRAAEHQDRAQLMTAVLDLLKNK